MLHFTKRAIFARFVSSSYVFQPTKDCVHPLVDVRIALMTMIIIVLSVLLGIQAFIHMNQLPGSISHLLCKCMGGVHPTDIRSIAIILVNYSELILLIQ